ncbi:LysR family transcriptional regulator [Pseudomonas fluorescens]|uniref:LysR family transcriptional regulator n=1 Tax=Pseudomonas fluorescens TaxID=294 RepID=A0A1T2ZAD3_PSEFL|nr:LysR family transcriptional regulator [Pseudomonas fluorescens]OPB00944.1 LysR family transcriptional regulator [Pseudomonas fluorescens]
MPINLKDLSDFVVVARAMGFRDGARASGVSASKLSEAVRRLETQLGVRLLHRTTRSVVLTESGRRLLERLGPALIEVEASLDAVNSAGRSLTGTLRLNVPVYAARLILPKIIPHFLAANPGVRMEVTAESSVIDVLEAGYDAGIRYDERLEQDMIAVPIGPSKQRFATAAAPDYLARYGRPRHPGELLSHACLSSRFAGGALEIWEFERKGEVVKITPAGPLIVRAGTTIDLAVDAAIAGTGIIYLFEDWLRPHFDSGVLEPVLEQWWQDFSGPFLYYYGNRLVPAPLRAFIDFINAQK